MLAGRGVDRESRPLLLCGADEARQATELCPPLWQCIEPPAQVGRQSEFADDSGER